MFSLRYKTFGWTRFLKTFLELEYNLCYENVMCYLGHSHPQPKIEGTCM